MTNQEINSLKRENYVLKSQPGNTYWLNYAKSILNVYKNNYGDNFNLVVYSQPNNSDYYIIPFNEVSHLFIDDYLSDDDDVPEPRRWVIQIKNHIFKLTNNSQILVDVKKYYSNPYLSINYNNDDDNDYEIGNKRQEANVRLKQSVFRERVLENFNYTCCISNITEKDLLVASHIVPWADKKETRIDPVNGLCLSPLYDKLFDLGYFTLTDDLIIRVFNDTSKRTVKRNTC